MNSFSAKTIVILFGLGVSHSLRAAGPVEVTPAFIDQLMVEAQQQSPRLQAAQAQLKAATASVDSVRTWDDPTASFGISAAGSGGFSASEEGDLVYGISQKLPLYGRPDLIRKVAAAGAAREQLASESESQALRRDIAVALAELALAGREAELSEQDLVWIDSTLAEVDRLYRVGQASQVDWLKIQTEKAMASEELTSKEQERGHGALALNRLLNRNLHAPWPQMAIPPVQPAIYFTQALVEAAQSAAPQLKVMRQETKAAEASAELTRKQRLPDVSVGVQAWQYSGDGGVREGTLTVSFTVPWLNRARYGNDWERDNQHRRASEFAATDYALSVSEDLHHHIVHLDEARRQALLYKDKLIPLTEQTLSSAQTSWEHKLGPFQDILEAHRLLLADQLALARALSEQASRLAEISYLTGNRTMEDLITLAGNPSDDHEAHSMETLK